MTTTTSITLTFSYSGTDFTRKYKFEDVPNSALSGITQKVKAINDSLASGTDGGLSSFFLSDDFDETIGFFSAITAASSDVTNVNIINLND